MTQNNLLISVFIRTFGVWMGEKLLKKYKRGF